jgi:hypothetical protein
MEKLDWSTFLTAYHELTKRGVSHDAAADKALYLAGRGTLPYRCNWALVARRCQISEARSAHNQRCISLFTVLNDNKTQQEVVLADILSSQVAEHNPEQTAIARDELRQVPSSILRLFTDHPGPLTSTEYVLIHRFRKRFSAQRCGG